MEKLKFNETPVRTSRNYNINNIKLDNLEIPDEISDFINFDIIKKTDNIIIDNNIENKELKFGMNDVLNNQLNTQSNFKQKIIINDKEKNETFLNFNFDKNNTKLVENIELEINENCNSTVIIKYQSEGDTRFYHNGSIKAHVNKNSKLNVIILNFMNINSDNFLSIENNVEENSNIDYCIIDFGGKNSITNYYSNLEGKQSDNNLNTIYLGQENQVIDLNYIAELRGEKSEVNIEVQGALKDNSKKHFKGTIDFKKGCKKAKGNENENCMLLSDKARSIALPMLLCSEEDVEGNHSCSAGKIGDKELFYIMSRGFDLKQAMKLMIRAKFNKILENIENNEIKQQILDKIDEKLN